MTREEVIQTLKEDLKKGTWIYGLVLRQNHRSSTMQILVPNQVGNENRILAYSWAFSEAVGIGRGYKRVITKTGDYAIKIPCAGPKSGIDSFVEDLGELLYNDKKAFHPALL